jgi:cytoskeletal protein CcmA (bactofilin family)
MRIVGDCITEGTVRIEGSVRGTVWAGKAVVVGTEGAVHGEVRTQDAVIAGEVVGSLLVASRLEIQGSARIEGEIHARRVQLEEGAVLNGDIRMGDIDLGPPPETMPIRTHEDGAGLGPSTRGLEGASPR